MRSILKSILTSFGGSKVEKRRQQESAADNEAYSEDDPGSDSSDDSQSSSQGQSRTRRKSDYSRMFHTPSKSVKPTPKISDLVNDAIMQLKERKGSTVDSILVFLVKRYKMDPESCRKSIKGYVKRGLSRGSILRTGGEGINSTFKLSPATKREIAKSNRMSAAKGKRPLDGLPSGIMKRQRKITSMALFKGRIPLAPTIPSKRTASLLYSGPLKRMKTDMNESGAILQGKNLDFDIPNKQENVPIMKPKRNREKAGTSSKNGFKKSSKTQK